MIDIVDNYFDKTRIQLCPLNFYLGIKTQKYSSLISKNGSVFIRKKQNYHVHTHRNFTSDYLHAVVSQERLLCKKDNNNT